MHDQAPVSPYARYVGQSVPRLDALGKVTGQAMYPGDLTMPGMLHMKTLFAGRPHARILRLDAGRALAAPGVVAVLTAQDVPVNEYGLELNDQPVLCGDVVRFEGDQVAVALAETEQAAAEARDLIEVVYADLPVITDPREAMRPDRPRIHANLGSNILKQYRIRQGNTAQGFAQAAAVVAGEYYLPMQEHAYLQPEAGLAYMQGDVVVIETAGQWPHHDQRQIAHALGLPLERVRVVYREVGGAFGGREDLSVQIVLALAAWRTGRPVKTIWSREESIRGHCKRHQMHIKARWGATREGRLTAAEVEVIADAGAYAYTSTMVLAHAAMTTTGVYDIPNVKVDAYAVHTNNIPGGAFRGFGAPQGLFTAEVQMDKLAEALGLDPVAMRERNLLREGGLLNVGTPLPEGICLDRLLDTCARAAGWTGADGDWRKPEPASEPGSSKKRGIGLALGMKNVGFSHGYPEESSAVIELRGRAEVKEALLRFAGAECGQGTSTVIQQMAADALGLPLEKVRLLPADTHLAPEAGSASASRLTLMGGQAILGAAQVALAAWRNEERPAVGAYTYHAPPTTSPDPDTGHCTPNIAFSPVAQAVEIEVDLETGRLRVPRVVSVVDAGRAINPALVEGQTEGAVAQALGYAVMENFVAENGMTLTPHLSTYLLPTVLDVPHQVETILLETPDPIGPWGARGMAEMPFLAIAPALVSALKDATGVWIDRLPLTPSTLLARLRGEH